MPATHKKMKERGKDKTRKIGKFTTRGKKQNFPGAEAGALAAIN